MDNPLIEDAFEVLENATRQEKNGNRVEAATKYFEATYLLKQIYQSTPICHSQIRSLLKKKIDYYGAAASRLYFDERSTAPTMLSNPRSPTMGQKIFFSEGNNREAISPLSSATRSSFTQSQTAELNQTASHANTKLSQAIDLDEKNKEKTKIIEAYMAAAQLYLNTIRLAEISSSSSIASVLKRRLEGALDRVEQLKASSRGDVKKHQSQKRMSEDSNGLTDREIAILKKSSLIASGLFLPFSESDATKLSQQVESNESPSLFTDDKLLPLSSKQQERFYKWARPSEIVKLRSKWKKKELPPPVMIQSVNPYSIRQQYVTDCSFIASLCICAAFAKRFRQRLISKIVYPQNSSGIPIYNPAGKYIVKLWLNGVARQVVIDDQLPVDMHGNLLCSDTKTPDNRLELWVSIIEKAYMKLCGGYNFPGSNSGVDLFSLTGWIPERIFFPCHDDKVRDFETEPERAWERLFSANSFGDCLITVSTSKEIQEAQAQKVGLITGHAYAVLHVIQTSNGIRLLQMKNPWASKGWRGQYSCHDLASWSSALRNETGYDPKIAAQYDDGIFWISWKDVLKYFQNLQLSWNPKLFQHQVMTHDFWPAAQGPKNDTFNVSENPQYTLTLSQEAIKKQATIWILISRHVTKQEQEGADVSILFSVPSSTKIILKFSNHCYFHNTCKG
jgi:calpain-7